MNGRSYAPVTLQEQAQVAAAFRELGSYVEVSKRLSLTTNRVRHVIGLARRAGEVGPSLRKRSSGESISAKNRVLAIIVDAYSPLTTDQVAGSLSLDGGAYVSRHALVHLLHSLRKGQLITFDEDKATGNGADPIRITAVRRTNGRVDVEELAPAPVAEPEKHVFTSEYPLLDALLSRKDAIVDAQAKAKRYMEAANLLADDDEDTALLLMEKSREMFASVALTPLEDEYLTYAAQYG